MSRATTTARTSSASPSISPHAERLTEVFSCCRIHRFRRESVGAFLFPDYVTDAIERRDENRANVRGERRQLPIREFCAGRNVFDARRHVRNEDVLYPCTSGASHSH